MINPVGLLAYFKRRLAFTDARIKAARYQYQLPDLLANKAHYEALIAKMEGAQIKYEKAA